MKSVRKSRVWAVLLTSGGFLGAYHIHKRTETENGESNTYLDIQMTRLRDIGPQYQDEVTRLLVNAGVTVRFYDPEEKRWMDNSLVYGLVPAPGGRDGTFSVPATVEEFDRDYLETV